MNLLLVFLLAVVLLTVRSTNQGRAGLGRFGLLCVTVVVAAAFLSQRVI
jgi:hypothetical protein